MDSDALRIRELVIEAGALIDWLETGRGDVDVVGAALLYLRDELCHASDQTNDDEACQAAGATITCIDRALMRPAAPVPADRKDAAA